MNQGAANLSDHLGDFTIFGFSKLPQDLLLNRLSDRFGMIPKLIKFGDIGNVFFYSTYGQVVETEAEILLKIGFLRAPDRTSIAGQQMIDQKLIGLEAVTEKAFSGNGLIAYISKKEPGFSVYKTLLAVPQLYYAISEEGIVCSDRMKLLIRLIDEVRLNEDVLPMHFLFRSVIGPSTYYRDVSRLLPGEFLTWKDGKQKIRLIQNLHLLEQPMFRKVDDKALEFLYQSLDGVTADYLNQVERDGCAVGNLLSGGVDSSLIQFVINRHTAGRRFPSFSFAAKAPSFDFEIQYAQRASDHFHTQHTFVDFRPEDYPGLLIETIDHLAQPPTLPSEPGIFATAKYLKDHRIPLRYFMSGQGADTLFGLPIAKNMLRLHYVSHVPGSALAFKTLGKFLKPFSSYGQRFFDRGVKLETLGDENALSSPLNSIGVYVELPIAMRCFGEATVRKVLAYRRQYADQYFRSSHYLEKPFVIDLVTDTYEVAVQRHHMFLSQGKEIIHPFLDQDMIRAGFSFDPNIRYIYKSKPKYLLKMLLDQKAGMISAWSLKGATMFHEDLFDWMTNGPLQPLVRSISLPGFLSRQDFEKMIRQPDMFLWGLLVLDLFQKTVLDRR